MKPIRVTIHPEDVPEGYEAEAVYALPVFDQIMLDNKGIIKTDPRRSYFFPRLILTQKQPPDPLAEYTEDELTVARAIVAGKLEIPSRVTRVFRYEKDWLCCIGDCDRSAVYASAILGPWPLSDEPCDIDMSRIMAAVAIMREVK